MCTLAVRNMRFFIYFIPGSGTRFVNMLFFNFPGVVTHIAPVSGTAKSVIIY